MHTITKGKNFNVYNTIRELSHGTNQHRFQSLMIDIVAPMVEINTDPRVAACIQALCDHRDGKISSNQLYTTRYDCVRAARAAARVQAVSDKQTGVNYNDC